MKFTSKTNLQIILYLHAVDASFAHQVRCCQGTDVEPQRHFDEYGVFLRHTEAVVVGGTESGCCIDRIDNLAVFQNLLASQIWH